MENGGEGSKGNRNVFTRDNTYKKTLGDLSVVSHFTHELPFLDCSVIFEYSGVTPCVIFECL